MNRYNIYRNTYLIGFIVADRYLLDTKDVAQFF